jgi:hypothetical protein
MGARRQIAAGRRYLRILKFTDAFAFAFEACGDKTSGLRGYLECGKWSCLGCYLLIESCTMVCSFLLCVFISLGGKCYEGCDVMPVSEC